MTITNLESNDLSNEVIKKPSKLQEKINWYLTIIVLVLFTLIPPISCGLLYLSRVPDVTWGDEASTSYTRIWMYRERRPVGIGYQRRHVVIEYNENEVCVETRLRFLLWGRSDRAEPATKHQRMILVDGRWQPTGERC